MCYCCHHRTAFRIEYSEDSRYRCIRNGGVRVCRKERQQAFTGTGDDNIIPPPFRRPVLPSSPINKAPRSSARACRTLSTGLNGLTNERLYSKGRRQNVEPLTRGAGQLWPSDLFDRLLSVCVCVGCGWGWIGVGVSVWVCKNRKACITYH